MITPIRFQAPLVSQSVQSLKRQAPDVHQPRFSKQFIPSRTIPDHHRNTFLEPERIINTPQVKQDYFDFLNHLKTAIDAGEIRLAALPNKWTYRDYPLRQKAYYAQFTWQNQQWEIFRNVGNYLVDDPKSYQDTLHAYDRIRVMGDKQRLVFSMDPLNDMEKDGRLKFWIQDDSQRWLIPDHGFFEGRLQKVMNAFEQKVLKEKEPSPQEIERDTSWGRRIAQKALNFLTRSTPLN